MVLKPNFPLPKGYFGDARLSEEQERAFRDVVRKRLASALRDEDEFVYTNQRQVDASQWRLVKKKHQLRIFRRRRVLNSVTSDEDTWRPSMLSVGRMEGTLEDVLYGAYDKSDEELKTTIAFADVATKDCAVLHTLALAKPDDPFHYIGMKWFLTQLPASIIVKPRDWCYMEAMGIEKDASAAGRFGYIILHSVDLKSCPPFDRRAVVRGRTQLSFIFREPVPGIVEVFSQGLFDPAGELIQRFTTVMTSEVLAGVFKMAQCAEAKKLTLLALRNEADRTKAAMAMTSSSTSNGSTSNSNSNSASRPEKTCHLCKGTGRMFSSLKHCRVCGVTVCSQCRVKKSIFMGPAHSVAKVNCCRTCLTHAQNMEIRPAEPEFSILGEQHLAPDQVSNIESSSGTPDDGEPTPRQNLQSTRELTADGYGDDYGDNDDDQLSELDVNGYRFSNESGISEDDVEKLIASMMQQRALASSGVAGGNSNGEATRAGDEAGGGDENRPVAATTAPVSYDRVPLVVVQALPGGPVSRETGETQQATDDAMSNNSTASSSGGQGAGSEPVPSSDGDSSNAATTATMTPEQAAIFEKILLLQSAANEVYSITQANNEMMRSLPDASSVAP